MNFNYYDDGDDAIHMSSVIPGYYSGITNLF